MSKVALPMLILVVKTVSFGIVRDYSITIPNLSSRSISVSSYVEPFEKLTEAVIRIYTGSLSQ